MKEWRFVYILECRNGHFYTGIADDMAARLRKHIMGRYGAKYTRSFPPVRIACCWRLFGERAEALKVERGIKSLDRKGKEELVEQPERLSDLTRRFLPGVSLISLDDVDLRSLEREIAEIATTPGVARGR